MQTNNVTIYEIGKMLLKPPTKFTIEFVAYVDEKSELGQDFLVLKDE